MMSCLPKLKSHFILLLLVVLLVILCNKHGNSAINNMPHSSEDAAIIVCGVDGLVYIFDAWSGNLRGLFSSGGALVSSSTSDDKNSSVPPPKQRIVPGLDGNIYTYNSA